MFISLFLFFNILRRKFASVHVGLEWAKEKLYILYHVMVPVTLLTSVSTSDFAFLSLDYKV